MLHNCFRRQILKKNLLDYRVGVMHTDFHNINNINVIIIIMIIQSVMEKDDYQ